MVPGFAINPAERLEFTAVKAGGQWERQRH
nr:MAG TPA: hypothetical protein [Caudoviricetes sp.]